MKNTLFLIPILFFVFFSCQAQVKTETSVDNSTSLEIKNKIQILEFFGKRRCTSCLNIEKNTKLTLSTHFADEMKSGKIEFKMINYDLPENEKIVDKYGAYGTSLYLITLIDEKETVMDLSSFAFMNNTNEDKYTQKLKVKIVKQLNKL